MECIIGFFSLGRPKHFVSRWIIFDEECSLGYELTDSSVGVIFKDNSRLIADDTMENFQYIDESNMREYFEYDKFPTKLKEKSNLLDYYKDYMETEYDKFPTKLKEKSNLLDYYKDYMETYLVADQPLDERERTKVIDKGIPILLKWKRNDKCICFLLLNGVLQVNFHEDHTKLIISAPTKSISIIDKDNKLETHWYKGVHLFGWNAFKEKKLSYVMEVVEEWISLEKKHEDDDSAVQAKTINNNI
uniref:Polo kinase n=1 Tax=Strongyloides papillosus TaxID=174720 RepID=A0A0N5BIY9_STREA